MHGWASVLPSGFTIIPLDLSPGSDAYDILLWSEPASTRDYLNSMLGNRESKAGIISVGDVVMAWVDQSEPSGLLANIAISAAVLAAPGTAISWPGTDAVVEKVDSLKVQIGDPESGQSFIFEGLQPAVEVGNSLSRGDVIGTISGKSDDPVIGNYVCIKALGGDPRDSNSSHLVVTKNQFEEARANLAKAFASIGLTADKVHLSSPEIVELREKRLARSQRAYYKKPPALVRASGVWMYDENGRVYLDTINNVTHVGHSNPRITAAATRQLSKLNTNSRFVYEGLAKYADRLVATLPDPLEVVFFVCTGSEANDLALRISRQVTGRKDIVILDGAYHGNTTAVMEISPNRYKGPGGRGKPETTHELETPNLYRGSYRYGDESAGAKYVSDARAVFDRLAHEGRPPAAFIAESLMGTAGNVVLPDGYLSGVFAAARNHGALCISDEVQVGAARFGNHFWGFQDQGVVPDLVTMGKPIGNGHPMAAVVTTREIAQAFDDGVKYFNTFAGNPVSCAIGMEVLQIIEDQNLQENAKNVGAHLLGSLGDLRNRHQIVGDVRGKGLYMGIELVRDRESMEPAKEEAYWVSEELLNHGVISYPTGVYDNVLKVKPPMIFDKSHADYFVEALDRVLANQAKVFGS